ncbi:probable serine/threonine-protein kinase DDB_G0283337 isoform X2 [Cydia pomonella]|uniref:probable serine/threonine-protein kinase DDB_G0283337 isoform X2 n=1 Tax=Cydia pomonella TaxID=82600 RepID=UPI002ADD7584|nr:probable serine/threonine-protein kinase DDB_G0283337 isoform X2 [Cydia pomonella]
MLTLFLIIILTNFKLISGLEINDTKFINSLPEKQKKEFLQKVEKRIQNEVPEVKSPELNDTNVDLYEKRLEDQGKSIQNILRSEIENLKNHHRRNLNDTERIEASHIDLTLRSNNDISEATRRKGEESNNLESDLHRKENSEKQTHYVPVYNYDPENAYYNANNKQSNGNVEEESIIKIKETRSKSTNFDVYTDENKKSLRVKDVKERMISNNKIIQTSDLYDIILSDVSEESPEDSVFIEKPLKHTLKKIRTKLYKNKINEKSKDGVNNNDIITITAENKDEVDNSSNTDNNEKKSIAELFTNFGALLQNMVDRANDNETPSSEGKKDSDNNGNDSDKTSYKDIANSLENHNKVLNTKGIQQIVTVIKYIQDKLGEKSKNKRNKKQHQSRFHVKNRDEKYKQKQERIYASFVQNDINYPNFESQDQKIGKSASKIKDDYLEIHINILKNLIDRNDLGLEKYDWLGTTVFIRAGLEKIQEITEKRLQGKKLHHLDQKLLEFVMELYKSAKEIVESQANEQQLSLTQRKKVSSKISKPKKGKKLNRFHRRLLYSESIGGVNKVRTVASSKSDVEDFKESLDCLEMCLNDLHTAIKQISLITTYKKQHWFKNIKQLYLQSANEKEYLELFLHLVMARLMDLIDARAKKMNTEDDNFLKRDKVAVDRIEVEFVLAMKICIKIAELRE